MTRRPARPSILRRAAAALGIARIAPAEPLRTIADAVALADAVEAEAPPAAPITPATGRRRRRASAAEVAKGIAYELVDQGLVGYPILPDDVDAAGKEWCAARDLDPAPPSLVREALAALPGVNRSRTRLRTDDAAHIAIARRLRRMGRSDDRATLFAVAAVPAGVHLNLMADTALARAAAGGQTGLELRVIAPRQSESKAGRRAVAGVGGGSEAAPLAGRAVA